MVSLQKGDSSDQKDNLKDETPQMPVGGTLEPRGRDSDGTLESGNSVGSEVHDRDVRESHNQVSSEARDQVALSESRDQIVSSESRTQVTISAPRDQITSETHGQVDSSKPIHHVDSESLHSSIEVQNSAIANGSHVLEIDSESLLIVEDHFQAPEVTFELHSETSENGESLETSRQNGLSNSNGRLKFSPPVGHCWFSFDDLWVRPITDRTLRTAYQGKESAYMLFYRRKALARPREGHSLWNKCRQNVLVVNVHLIVQRCRIHCMVCLII